MFRAGPAGLLIEACDDNLAAIIEEAVGAASLFQEREGYHPDLLRPSIKDVLPAGWEARLVPLADCENVFCLEPHDLAVAKLQAGRPKDLALLCSPACSPPDVSTP